MSTSRKIIAATIAAVIVGLIALVVLAKVLVTPERIKGALLPRVGEALSRQVEIEQVDISLFSGIGLKNLAVMEREGGESFLTAQQVTLRYRFWPLLLMRVEIDEIAVDKPQIHLVRFADGSFNFSDLLQLAGDKSEPEKQEAAPPATESDEGEGIKLLVSRLAIAEGTIRFTDHQANATPLHYSLDNLALQLSQFSPTREFPIELSATLNGASLSMQGRANLAHSAADAKVLLSGLEVMPFFPYFREQLPGRLQRATVDLDLQLSLDKTQMTSDGQVRLQNLDLQLNALRQAPLKGAQLAVEHKLQFDRADQRLVIDHARMALNQIPLYLAGRIELGAKRELDLNLRLNEMNLAQAMAALPAGVVEDLVGLEPSGLVTARLHLAGSLDRPRELPRDGELRLDGVQALVGGLRPALTGLVTVKGDALLADNLQLLVGDNRLQLECEAQSIRKWPMVVVANVLSDRLVVDQLLPAKKAPSATGGPASSGAEVPPSQPGPLDLPLKLSGTASIKQALYRGLAIDGLQARYRLENNLLQLEEVTGQVAGGSFRNSASIDLGKKGFAYSAQLATQGIQADPLVSILVPKAAGTVFGLLNLDLDLAGQGTDLAVLRKNLTGRGQLLIQEGRLTGSNLVKGLADFLQLPELSVMGFDQADGRFAINNGRLDLTSTLVSQDLRLSPRGDVGLDGTLDVGLDLRLSPDLTEKLGSSGRFSRLLVDADGWGQVPLKVKGSVSRPSFTLDSAVLKDALKQKAQQKLQETLQKKLLGDEEPTGQDDPHEKEKKLLEGVIKGLFGP